MLQWLEQGASAFSADDLVAVGKALCGKSVGEVEHGERGRLLVARGEYFGAMAFAFAALHRCCPTRLEYDRSGRNAGRKHVFVDQGLRPPLLLASAAGSLFLLNAQSNTSMLDFVNNCFDIKDNHHVHHR